MSIYGYRKSFMEKLRESITPSLEKRMYPGIMEKKFTINQDFVKPVSIQFSRFMEDILPQSQEELEYLLYVYGHILCEGLENHIYHLKRMADDSIKLNIGEIKR